MRDYIYIEDVDGLQDNILDEDCKIIYLKQNLVVQMRFTSLFTGRQSHQYMSLIITLD